LLGVALLLLVHRQHARLRALVWTDPLTGLSNHRGFHERLEAELARARRETTSLALVLLDLDNFKQVNDRHGHPYGDEVLRAVGTRLSGAIRKRDVAGRIGGEEFALILPDTDAESALQVAERARAAVARVSVHELELTCSAGIAAFPTDADDASTLAQLADGALYWAKRTGKHRTRRFDPHHVRVGDIAKRARALAAELGQPGTIVPVRQPVVALATGRVVGYESLSRFPRSPDRAPESWFLEAAACGLGPELEAAAIRAALEPLGRPPGTHLALNLSPSALSDPAVHAALPADLTDLVIEITEHEDILAADTLLSELESLRERGALIAIDDAGAGHSGLSQLMQIRPDIVKLDIDLVRGIHADPARMALVESFVRFAERIGATVCAEGIENLDDLRAVADLDVPWGQGFALARPAEDWPEVAPRAVEACRTALAEALRPASTGPEPAVVAGDRLLERLSGALASARSRVDLDKALAMIAAELNADQVCLSSWHPEERALETLAESKASSDETKFELADYPLTEGVLDRGEAAQVMVGDPTSDPGEVELLLSFGHRSLLMVPVVQRGESRGLVEAYSNADRAWTRTEINRARIISNQFASTIEAFFSDEARSD
jgi:diguanylate cyclase (GGDEF)-like protein